MMQTNVELEQAWEFVEHTGTSVFLTGKAGTGKTTFLRNVVEKSQKRLVVVAPTGVASRAHASCSCEASSQLKCAIRS